jgi:hypothetical protein
MQFTVKASGALNMRPSAFRHLASKNISTAENDTGRTSRDIVKKPIPDGTSGILKATKFELATIGKLEFSIRNAHTLFGYVEEKTKPHVITPKNKKALVFAGKGGMVFARRVNHPGTPGKHSFRQGWEFVRAVFKPSVQQAIDAAFEGRAYSGGGAIGRSAPTAIRI